MKLRRSLYPRPRSSEESNAPRRALDGRATPSGCLVAAVVAVALAVLPSPKPALVCQAANARPHSRGLGVSRRADFVVVAIQDVRVPSMPWFASCPHRFWFAMACRVEGTVSGRIRRGRRCPEGCPIVASIVDAGHDRVDIGRGPGLRTFRHRAGVQVVTMGGSRCWERLRLAEGSRRIVVLSGHGQDERAAWLAVAGWPGAWSDAGRWRCPLLGRRRPDRVRYPSAGRSP